MGAYAIAAIIAIVVYMAFSLAVGLGLGYKKEVVSTSRGYFIGTGTQNFILFFTTVATWFSTGLYQGVVGSLYKNGIGWIGISTWQLLVVSCMGVFGPRFWKLSKSHNFVTPAQLVSDYYQSKGFKLIIAVGMLAFCIPSMMAQIRGVSWAINAITDNAISFNMAIVIVAIIVGIYVYFGGFNSQAWVDTAQGLLFIVVLWGCLFIVAGVNGGWSESWRRLAESAPDVLFYKDTSQYWSWRRYISFFFIQGLGGFFAPYVWQRTYAAKSSRDCRKLAGYMGAFFCFAVCLPVVFCGLNMHVAMPAMENPENGLVTFMAEYAPGWAIFVSLGILAAGMSTISSILVTCSSILAVDIGETIRPDAADDKVRQWGRMLVLAILLIGVVMSFMTIQTIEILINLTLAGFAQMIIPVLGIFVFKRMTKEGACAGYLAGLIVSALGTITWNNPLGFMGGAWGFLANIVICIAVSAVTKPVSDEHRAAFLAPLKTPDQD